MTDHKNTTVQQPFNLREFAEAVLGAIGLIISIGAVLYMGGIVQATL